MKTKIIKWLRALIKDHCQSKGYESMRGCKLLWKVNCTEDHWLGDTCNSYEQMADWIIEHKKGWFDIHTKYNMIDDVNCDLLFDDYKTFDLDKIMEAK